MRSFEFPFDWYRKFARHWLFWLGVPIALYSWTLTGPLLSDDLHLILKAERYLRGESDRFELYRFAASDEEWRQLRDRGVIPWWAPPTGRLDFFRPMMELSFLLDVRFFGRNPLGFRLVSMGFFVVALCCVRRLFRAAGADEVHAGTATYFYGLSQTVTPPVTWMCNRQDLLVVIGVTVAATAYWEAVRRPRVTQLFLAMGAFLFALLSKEVAIALAGVVGLHEIIARRRPDARSGRRMACWIALALALMAAGYLSYYVYSRPWALQVASGSDGGSSQFGRQLPLSLLLYAAVWTIGFPIDVLHAATNTQALAVGVIGGVLMLLTIRYLRRSTHRDAAAMFFVLWAVFFIVPGLRALTASTRTLCTASVGWSYLLVGLFFATRTGAPLAPLPMRAWLNAANGVISAGCAIGTVIFMNATESRARERIQQTVADLAAPLQDGDTLVVDRAESSFEMLCAGDRLEYLTGRRNVAALFLVGPGIDATLSREDDRTIMVRAKHGDLFSSPIHQLTLGPHWNPRRGQQFETRDFIAEIVEVSAEHHVTAMRFRFREPFTTPRLHFWPPVTAANPTPRGAAP
ncbi:MAG TPA: hypothetical protein VJZ71_03895 [Phycisphaerae bacterium]|nr:hypothetical protein [Phycisphaerae bacterium]